MNSGGNLEFILDDNVSLGYEHTHLNTELPVSDIVLFDRKSFTQTNVIEIDEHKGETVRVGTAIVTSSSCDSLKYH